MFRDLAEFVDLEVNYLLNLRNSPFLRQLRRLIRALYENAHLKQLIDDLHRERDDLLAKFKREYDDLMQELLRFKAELVELDPASQERNATKPKPGEMNANYPSSLAWFDELANAAPPANLFDLAQRVGEMTTILLTNIDRLQYWRANANPPPPLIKVEENQRKDLNPLAQKVLEAIHKVGFLRDALFNEKESNPAFALVELEEFVNKMLPGPTAERFLDPLAIQAGDQIDKWEAQYRPIVQRVQHELRLRIGSRGSNVALLERFRGRCQWHEREELYKLAATGNGKPEDRLVRVMERWLYDQGLNPIAQVSAGGLRPDLFDPSRRPAVFVEAKQYRGSPLATIRAAVRQVDDTAGQFTAEPYQITEAFLAVFRLGGSLAIPATLVLSRGAYSLYIVVIDLKPLEFSGSRQKEAAVLLTEDAILAPVAPRHRQPTQKKGRKRRR
jgi:hypothetical protein